ncbi:hypothetical protein V6N13_093553 [Hibiscus sabdariffa]|uniref:Uncharacterized protein n=1 Tax=Hibiscus sabdariffa TaxID=183260 RepID=A0ABR2BRC7_9ROSI
MLKRKIHPEVEGRGNKLNKQCSKKKHEVSESVHLLQQSPGEDVPQRYVINEAWNELRPSAVKVHCGKVFRYAIHPKFLSTQWLNG